MQSRFLDFLVETTINDCRIGRNCAKPKLQKLFICKSLPEDERKRIRKEYVDYCNGQTKNESLQKIVTTIGIPVAKRHIFLCAEQTKPKCCDYERGVAAFVLKYRLLPTEPDWATFDKGNPLTAPTPGARPGPPDFAASPRSLSARAMRRFMPG